MSSFETVSPTTSRPGTFGLVMGSGALLDAAVIGAAAYLAWPVSILYGCAAITFVWGLVIMMKAA